MIVGWVFAYTNTRGSDQVADFDNPSILFTTSISRSPKMFTIALLMVHAIAMADPGVGPPLTSIQSRALAAGCAELSPSAAAVAGLTASQYQSLLDELRELRISEAILFQGRASGPSALPPSGRLAQIEGVQRQLLSQACASAGVDAEVVFATRRATRAGLPASWVEVASSPAGRRVAIRAVRDEARAVRLGRTPRAETVSFLSQVRTSTSVTAAESRVQSRRTAMRAVIGR